MDEIKNIKKKKFVLSKLRYLKSCQEKNVQDETPDRRAEKRMTGT